jgi:hypothetical protein
MTSLIITAPHSLCSASLPYRNCDTVSLIASSRLFRQIYSMNTGLQIKYFPSNHHRDEFDLNRYESRNTDYRKNISNNLSDAILLIDIHSFEKKGFGSDVDVVLLDDYPMTQYSKLLYDIMKSNNISVAYLEGDPKINDIEEEARSRNIPAILIEYMETIPISTIDNINNSIIEWIGKILK